MTQLTVFHTWKKCFKFAFLPLKSWNLGTWEITGKMALMLTFSFSNLLSKMNSISNTHGDERRSWENQRDCSWNGWSEGERWTVLGVGQSRNRPCLVSETLGFRRRWERKGDRKEGSVQDVVVGKHGDSICPVPLIESGSRGTAVVFPVKQALHALAQPAFFQTLEKRSTGQKTRGKRDSRLCGGGAHWRSQGLSERVLSVSEGGRPGPLWLGGLCECSKACGRAEHSWDSLSP